VVAAITHVTRLRSVESTRRWCERSCGVGNRYSVTPHQHSFRDEVEVMDLGYFSSLRFLEKLGMETVRIDVNADIARGG
jgi:hypothetical protein